MTRCESWNTWEERCEDLKLLRCLIRPSLRHEKHRSFLFSRLDLLNRTDPGKAVRNSRYSVNQSQKTVLGKRTIWIPILILTKISASIVVTRRNRVNPLEERCEDLKLLRCLIRPNLRHEKHRSFLLSRLDLLNRPDPSRPPKKITTMSNTPYRVHSCPRPPDVVPCPPKIRYWRPTITVIGPKTTWKVEIVLKDYGHHFRVEFRSWKLCFIGSFHLVVRWSCWSSIAFAMTSRQVK